MALLIKGARILDASKDVVGDVYIKDGIIEKIDRNLNIDCNKIDGEGLVLLPSFIDMHSHFRDPGATHKEDLYTGSIAALKGGYTAVNLMANTNPVCSNMETVHYVIEKAKEIGLVDIHQTVSITDNFDGENIHHLDKLDSRVKFISDDGKGIVSNLVMLEAMKKAKEKSLVVISHAEDEALTKYDTRLSENIITSRDIHLAKYTGAHLHLAHVSTIEAMEEIIKAKKRGYKVTCEVSPHHISLTNKMEYRVNPPLRKIDDLKFLIHALEEGWVDVIATDHAPHTDKDKYEGAPGISGLETAFSVCYTTLVKMGHISLQSLSKLMSKNPGKLMGLNKGEIEIGYDGDMVLVDINARTKVDISKFMSKGKNTPFEGQEFWGQVVSTIKGGKVVYSKEEFKNDHR